MRVKFDFNMYINVLEIMAGVSLESLPNQLPLVYTSANSPPGQLSSEFFTERYPDGDHKVSLIVTGRDGASKRFDQVFNVQPLVASSSHASEYIQVLHSNLHNYIVLYK